MINFLNEFGKEFDFYSLVNMLNFKSPSPRRTFDENSAVKDLKIPI